MAIFGQTNIPIDLLQETFIWNEQQNADIFI